MLGLHYLTMVGSYRRRRYSSTIVLQRLSAIALNLPQSFSFQHNHFFRRLAIKVANTLQLGAIWISQYYLATIHLCRHMYFSNEKSLGVKLILRRTKLHHVLSGYMGRRCSKIGSLVLLGYFCRLFATLLRFS